MKHFSTYIKLLLIAYLILTGCKNNYSSKELVTKPQTKKIFDTIKNLRPEILYGKTFFFLTKTDSVDILYHYCNANINTIKVYENSIFEDFGQEDYTIKLVKKNIENNKIIFYGDNEQLAPVKKYTFKYLDKKQGYWKINNKIYIDSIYSSGIPNIEQPCTDCWDKDDCDEMERQKKLKTK